MIGKLAVLAPKQMTTAQSGTELINHICFEHDLATRHPCDLHIRHVRSLPHTRNIASNGSRSPLPSRIFIEARCCEEQTRQGLGKYTRIGLRDYPKLTRFIK